MNHLPSVVVLGDITLDIVFSSPIFPEEGAEIVVRSSNTRLGGSGCNTAVALSLLGAPVKLVGHLGQDPFGEVAFQELSSVNVDTSLVERVPGGSTGFMMILITTGGKRTMFGFRGCNALPPDPAQIKLNLETAGWLHVSGYSFLDDSQWTAVRQAIRNAFQKGTPISIDPSLEAARRVRERILEVIPECQVLLASRPEIQALSECEDLESGIKVLQAKGTRIMGIKMGEQGCKVMFGDEQVDIPPMTGKKVIDTTGAGDSFNAGFVFGQLSGWSRANSARLGNALAYQVITSGKGIAGLRDPGEIANALKTA